MSRQLNWKWCGMKPRPNIIIKQSIFLFKNIKEFFFRLCDARSVCVVIHAFLYSLIEWIQMIISLMRLWIWIFNFSFFSLTFFFYLTVFFYRVIKIISGTRWITIQRRTDKTREREREKCAPIRWLKPYKHTFYYVRYMPFSSLSFRVKLF